MRQLELELDDFRYEPPSDDHEEGLKLELAPFKGLATRVMVDELVLTGAVQRFLHGDSSTGNTGVWV